MFRVELSLRSQLAKEALSTVLTMAGFLVLTKRDRHDGGVTAIVDVDGGESLEMIATHRLNGDRIVVLTNDADALELDDDQSASLSGILTYDLSTEAFVRSLRLICSGEQVFADRMAPGSQPSGEPGTGGSGLSTFEREVLSHVLEGHADKVIARHLGTSEAAAKVHLNNLLRKIRVPNRTEATVWALDNLPEFGPARRGFV